MNKIFIRILAGLVAIFFALGLFSVIVFNVTDRVREEHYWHDFLLPLFAKLAEPSSNLYQQLNAPSSYLPDGLSVVEFDRNNLSLIEYKRLQAGQLVMDLSHYQISAKFYLPASQIDRSSRYNEESDRLVILQAERGGDQIFEFSAWVLKSLLWGVAAENEDSANLQAKLDELAETLGFYIEKLEEPDILDAGFLLSALADKGWVKVAAENETLLYVRMPSAEIYKIVVPCIYSEFSLPVVLFLAICSIISVALLANVFVQSFDRRIRSIETAASRISRGELDARVTSAGEEDAISRLGKSFNSMADHIQRLMYVQKEMIHAVSHELRTPVARIRFGVQMIEDCQTPESVQKQVKGIDGDIQELDELIDEILTYARLEQGGPILAFQQADVAAIVEQVIAEQRSDKPDMKIYSEYKKGSEIWKESEIETRYIHRSIQNLVGNAKRYADSTVKVVCSFDSETCRIDVEDDGPGIPEDQWESVFTPFARLDDSRTRSSGGYGLGLSIVRRILYWHGGQAFLGRSELGGAKFSLVWPRKQNS